MASGPTCRAKRPNTWLHRPMLHTFKKVLANSEPSTHGGKADMSAGGCPVSRSLSGVKRTRPIAVQMSAYDPKRTNERRPRSARPQRTLSGHRSIESVSYRDQYRLD